MTRSLQRAQASIAAASLIGGILLGVPAAALGSGGGDNQTEYVVLAESGASAADVLRAIASAGGTVTSRNAAIGTFEVRGPAAGFVEAVSASAAVFGATHERPVGQIPDAAPIKASDAEVEALHPGAAGPRHGGSTAGSDPLDSLAWGLAMVKSDLARAVNAGDSRVLVGILDSGIDASHPDLAGQLETSLSRNFVTDIPAIDGPCEDPSCVDPATEDDSGHGTHVAGTVAAAANGLGVSGVAPGVRLVSIRGGQDSGYLFLGPVTNALTYGADIGVDVINMSFYVDPWLYNCTANPADSPSAQLEQRTIIEAMNRALDYANSKDVTLIGSLGNNHEDLGHPRPDATSPDYPPGTAYPRVIDNATCVDLPVEGHHVIGVSALGPSTAKADYSNYGLEQISLSAPGGWFRDGFGTPTFRTNGNQILSTYPLHILQAGGQVDAAGNVTPAGVAIGVMKDCSGTTCGYYAYLQGTSMASPHVTGVAALAVSRFGVKDPRNKGGLRLAAWKTEFVLTDGAAEHACPVPPLFSYAAVGRPPEFDALCEGTTAFNGFYGHGIVDAYATVTRKFEFSK
ncbi:MAG TPA: S8 family serine peptidase [Candidatus Limnocylindrales bacterium]|nr:S8 family serine peptidase [Candidatus Limnocylindrales bacterium]